MVSHGNSAQKEVRNFLEQETSRGGHLSHVGANSLAKLNPHLAEEVQRHVITRNMPSSSTSDGQRFLLCTSGPPGAGKSTAMDAIGGVSDGCFRIDPDVYREQIIESFVDDSHFCDLRERVSDLAGHEIKPMEMSGLAHALCIQVADSLQAKAASDGLDILREGTLSWSGNPQAISQDHQHYRSLHVVSVEVPAERSVHQAMGRWWGDRETELGGRFVSESSIRGLYEDPSGPSVCAGVARDTVKYWAQHHKGGEAVLTMFFDGERTPGNDLCLRPQAAMLGMTSASLAKRAINASVCGRIVKSTGRPCLLKASHRGHCRSRR